MIPFTDFLPYLLVMAGVTYLVRMLPLVLVKGKFENKTVRSFLYYIPYAVLGVMTLPGALYSTSSMLSAAIGLAAAVITAYFGRGLLTVAAASVLAVLLTEIIIPIF